MSCRHERRVIQRTYFGRPEDGGILASAWAYCADCEAFLSKRTTAYAFAIGVPGFFSKWEVPTKAAAEIGRAMGE